MICNHVYELSRYAGSRVQYVTFEIAATDSAAAVSRVAAELSAAMTAYPTAGVVVDGGSIRVTVGFDDEYEPAVVAKYLGAKIRRVLHSVGGAGWPVSPGPTPA